MPIIFSSSPSISLYMSLFYAEINHRSSKPFNSCLSSLHQGLKYPWPVSSICWEKWDLIVSRRRMLETRPLMIGFRSRPPGTRNGGTLHSTMWPPWLGLASSVSLTPWQGSDGMFPVSFIPKNEIPSAFTLNIKALLSWNWVLILFTEILSPLLFLVI